MRSFSVGLLALALVACLLPASAFGQSLHGSPASLDKQNRVANLHDFTRLQRGSQVGRFAEAGYLVRVRNGKHFRLHDISYPYARPEVNLFIERLGRQYHAACGRQLVVTSLTRPMSEQPRNGSRRSVHPTGMAIDLRYSRSRACRAWLESVLLDLEGKGIVEATRERYPPHYHVAVFPRPYAQYVARIEGRAPRVAQSSRTTSSSSRTSAPASTNAGDAIYHHVDRGHNLTAIAGRYGVTVSAVRQANNLSSDRILAGQTLRIPAVSHRIQRGETLSEIAEHYGVSAGKIRRVNGMSSSRILAGQTLVIPLER